MLFFAAKQLLTLRKRKSNVDSPWTGTGVPCLPPAASHKLPSVHLVGGRGGVSGRTAGSLPTEEAPVDLSNAAELAVQNWSRRINSNPPALQSGRRNSQFPFLLPIGQSRIFSQRDPPDIVSGIEIDGC